MKKEVIKNEEKTYKHGEVMHMFEQISNRINLMILQRIINDFRYKMEQGFNKEDIEKIEKRMMQLEKLVFARLT